MKIDAHQHFWNYDRGEYSWIDECMASLKRDFLPGDLAELLKQNNIDGTVAVQARQSLVETEWLLRLAENHNFIRGVVGWVELVGSHVESDIARFATNQKLKGLRHVLHDEQDDRYMLRDDFLRGLAKLQKFNLTYDILIFPRHIKFACQLVRRFPQQLFVVDHIAKPAIRTGQAGAWRQEMGQLAQAENVYCKISGMVTEASWADWSKADFLPYMEAVLEAFGAERLMFGSDWPVCTVAAKYDQVLDIVTDFLGRLSPTEQTKIMGRNAVNFYNLQDSHKTGEPTS
jgi:L-fuconolactonase